ncbi:hypothetical protein [Actinomycetospora endophytica]|uniref:hypothetical protein n=1 Tax=Actinomycetospora endophytica TaxID=2291215 RepID=UPI003556AF5A
MSTIDGLPAHVLLVHAVVVLVPLSALLLVLVALWPAARYRLVWPALVLTLLALVAVPLTTDAGEWLEHHVARSALVHTHTELGDTMLPWVIGLAVVAVVLAARHVLDVRDRARREGPGAALAPETARATPPGGTVATIVIAVLTVVLALGSVVTVYRIGESGARAAWTGRFSEQSQPLPGGPPPSGGG